MTTGDHLIRGMGRDATIRALAVSATETARAITGAHEALPTAAAALCRITSASLLLGGTIKGREQVSITVKGDGPIGELYAISDASGNVRVSIHNPAVHLPPREDGKFAVGEAIGPGRLTVTKSLGMKEPYQGIVPLVNSEIANDLVHYFHASEQKPSAMGLGELIDGGGVRAAGGFLIQAFPGVAEDTLRHIEATVAAMPPVSELLEAGTSPEMLLRLLLPDLVVLDRHPVQFLCRCSRERCEQILVALGEEELRSIIEDQETTDLRCHFCMTSYSFDRADLASLLESARSGVQ